MNHRLADSSRSRGGFTLIELMVSLTILLLGVITAAGVMVTTEHTAIATEERYLDYAELRNQVENFKTEVSTTSPQLTQSKSITLSTGHVGTFQSVPGAAGYPNLVRVELKVPSGTDAKPIQVVTYLRASEDRTVPSE